LDGSTVNENIPFPSVTVPMLVCGAYTTAPATGEPSSDETTVPVTVILAAESVAMARIWMSAVRIMAF
jgi:hypothetical protein